MIAEKPEGGLAEVLNNSELAACKGDANNILLRLREKGIMMQKQSSSL